MVKRRLKKEVLYVIYGLICVCLLIITFLVQNLFKKDKLVNGDRIKYVDKVIVDDDTIPVVNTSKVIKRPYQEAGVKIVLNYYNASDEIANQEKSLIYYESTYIPSTGIAYSNNKVFDVLAAYDGTILSIEESSTLGNIIKIDHGNNLISIYQGVSDIKVKENDNVASGTIIAVSGTSNILSSFGNHVYFELIHNGITVNPELYYDKKIDEI